MDLYLSIKVRTGFCSLLPLKQFCHGQQHDIATLQHESCHTRSWDTIMNLLFVVFSKWECVKNEVHEVHAWGE